MTHVRLAALAVALTLAPAAASALDVGVAAAVNPDTVGHSPDRGARTLMLGYDVAFKERIVTSAEGQTQILFLDESTLTVGPNSDITIDEFVYDPATDTGTLAMGAAKGVFRYVGGKISKRAAVEIRTPTATVGIRGGVALVDVAPDGATTTYFVYGEQMTVTGASGDVRRLERPGFKVTATAAGGVSAPQASQSGEIGAVLTSMQGAAGKDGGAAETPSDSAVERTEIVKLGSDAAPKDLATPSESAASPIVDAVAQVPANVGDIVSTDDALNHDDLLGGWEWEHPFGIAQVLAIDLLPLPTSGTATLTGTADGYIDHSGTIYTDFAPVTLVVDFDNRYADLTVSGWDGAVKAAYDITGRLYEVADLGGFVWAMDSGDNALNTTSGDPGLSGDSLAMVYRHDSSGVIDAFGDFVMDNGVDYAIDAFWKVHN